MGRKAYRIDEFFGIDQSRNENAIAPGMSADACNMDTENGSLAVAKGYVRHIPEPVPGTEPLHRLYVHQRREERSGEPCCAVVCGISEHECQRKHKTQRHGWEHGG